MDRFIIAIQNAVGCENWHAALGLALSMPDICGGLQEPGEKIGARYEKWFDRYLADVYTRDMNGTRVVFLTGSDCFALRCAFLHAGTGDVTEQRARDVLDKFYFTVKGVHRLKVESTLTLNVKMFCEEMCQGVGRWIEAVALDSAVQARLSGLLQIHSAPFSPHDGVLVR